VGEHRGRPDDRGPKGQDGRLRLCLQDRPEEPVLISSERADAATAGPPACSAADTLIKEIIGNAGASRTSSEARSAFDEVVREGARRILQEALEQEVAEYLTILADRRTTDGRRDIVHNGHRPERELTTGVGLLAIRQPRIRHRNPGVLLGP